MPTTGCPKLCCNSNKGALKPKYRPCKEEEKYYLAKDRFYFKLLVTLVMIIVIALYLFLKFNEKNSSIGTFTCTRGNHSMLMSDLADDGFADLYSIDKDGDKEVNQRTVNRFCRYKHFIIFLSWVFLVPYVMETMSSLTIIWLSMFNEEILIPFADGQYAGYDYGINSILSTGTIERCCWVSFPCLWLPCKIRRTTRVESEKRERFWESLRLGFLVLTLDIILNASLFVVSYAVLIDSRDVASLLTNLVSVQVFGQLDGIFVKMLMQPRASVGSVVANYMSPNPRAFKPAYSPFDAYRLSGGRHDFGLPSAETMEFYDYSGFRL